MLFASGIERAFATHPPLIERIRALDPGFDEREFKQVAARMKTEQVLPDGEAAAAEPAGAAAFAGATQAGPVEVQPHAIADLVGNPGTSHVQLAQSIRSSLPQEILERINDPAKAVGVLWSLLLDFDASVRQKQLAVLEQSVGPRHAQVAAAQYERIAALHPLQRLPLLMRLFPSLRRLAPAYRTRLLDAIGRLTHADGKLSVYEYALARVATQELEYSAAAARRPGRLKLSDVTEELRTAFSVLAEHGSSDALQARQAYEFGLSSLLPRERPEFRSVPDWVSALDAALVQLDQLMPAAKEALVEALVRTISHDNALTVGEAELLRAICATIHCPLPPIAA